VAAQRHHREGDKGTLPLSDVVERLRAEAAIRRASTENSSQ
jgi:hypothetical protein